MDVESWDTQRNRLRRIIRDGHGKWNLQAEDVEANAEATRRADDALGLETRWARADAAAVSAVGAGSREGEGASMGPDVLPSHESVAAALKAWGWTVTINGWHCPKCNRLVQPVEPHESHVAAATGEGAHVVSEHRAEAGSWWCDCRCGWKDFYAHAKREDALAAFAAHVAAATGEAAPATADDHTPTECEIIGGDGYYIECHCGHETPPRDTRREAWDAFFAHRNEAERRAREAAPAAAGDLRALYDDFARNSRQTRLAEDGELLHYPSLQRLIVAMVDRLERQRS